MIFNICSANLEILVVKLAQNLVELCLAIHFTVETVPASEILKEEIVIPISPERVRLLTKILSE
jgi:hypothetical protein